MKISASFYLSFWTIISVTFLLLGFIAFDDSHLSNSVSPVVISLFKYFLAISTCHSTGYALLFGPHRLKILFEPVYFCLLFFSTLHTIIVILKSPDEYASFAALFMAYMTLDLCVDMPFPDRRRIQQICMAFIIWLVLILSRPVDSWYYSVMSLFLIVWDTHLYRERTLSAVIHMAVISTMIFYSGGTIPGLVLYVLACFISIFSATKEVPEYIRILADVSYNWFSRAVKFQNVLLIYVNSRANEVFVGLREIKGSKFITFAVGMGGSVLFQNYFRLTTFSHVKAFLYLAVSWLANLTLLGASNDLGILNFALGNVIVGCTVNQFGLGGTTWVAYGASLFLYGLHLVLQSVVFVNEEGQEAQVILW